MNVKMLHDKKILEKYFRNNIDLNIYSLGDLDDFFWNYTTWYAFSEEEIKQIVLLYTGTSIPTVLAICDRNFEEMKRLLTMINPLLPKMIYAHLSPGLINIFEETYKIKSYGKHYKMALKQKNFLMKIKDKCIRRLGMNDYVSLKKLYDSSYPGNWFDKRMLETEKYFGYIKDSKIVAVAGIHVYSLTYGVAALGNITTDPNYRGQSICKKLTSTLCHDLLKSINNIGLNVHIENRVAIECYKKLGFEVVDEYEEFLLKTR